MSQRYDDWLAAVPLDAPKSVRTYVEKLIRQRDLANQRQEIIVLLKDGLTDAEIRRRTGAHNRAVPRIREELGLPASAGHQSTPQDKLAKFSLPVDEGGHTGWKGRRDNGGNPSIRHRNVAIPASHVAFELRTGRRPVGIVKSDCGVRDCLTPEHLWDEIERRRVRMQERALHGLDPQPWSTCPNGLHPWDPYGRLMPDLRPYCTACNTQRAARNREAYEEERTA